MDSSNVPPWAGVKTDDVFTFKARLSQISLEAVCIQTISRQMRKSGEKPEMMKAWLEATKKASSEQQLLALMYVANDVLQLCFSDRLFQLSFAMTVGQSLCALPFRSAQLLRELSRCLTIMQQRKVLPDSVLVLLVNLLDAAPKEAPLLLSKLHQEVQLQSSTAPATESAAPVKPQEHQPVAVVPPATTTLTVVPQADGPSFGEQEALRIEYEALTPRMRPSSAVDADASAVVAVRTMKVYTDGLRIPAAERELLSWLRRLLAESKARTEDIEQKTKRRAKEESTSPYLLLPAAQAPAEKATAQRVAVLMRREFHCRRLKAEVDSAVYYLLLDIIKFLGQRHSRLQHLVGLYQNEKRRRTLGGPGT